MRLGKLMALKILDFSSKSKSYSHNPPTKQEADSWLNWLRKKSAESEAKRKAEREAIYGNGNLSKTKEDKNETP